jgi:hypothetical protein
LSDEEDEPLDDELVDDEDESDFFSACLASCLSAPDDAESAVSRRRFAVP